MQKMKISDCDISAKKNYLSKFNIIYVSNKKIIVFLYIVVGIFNEPVAMLQF